METAKIILNKIANIISSGKTMLGFKTKLFEYTYFVKSDTN